METLNMLFPTSLVGCVQTPTSDIRNETACCILGDGHGRIFL